MEPTSPLPFQSRINLIRRCIQDSSHRRRRAALSHHCIRAMYSEPRAASIKRTTPRCLTDSCPCLALCTATSLAPSPGSNRQSPRLPLCMPRLALPARALVVLVDAVERREEELQLVLREHARAPSEVPDARAVLPRQMHKLRCIARPKEASAVAPRTANGSRDEGGAPSSGASQTRRAPCRSGICSRACALARGRRF